MRSTVRGYWKFGTLAVLVAVVAFGVNEATSAHRSYAVEMSASPAASPRAAVAAQIAGTETYTHLDDSLDPFPPPPGLVATPDPTAAPTSAPVAVVPTPAPATPVPVVVLATPQPTPVPVSTTCPSSYFCYPRLGIRGAIVPYTDCSGTTDVGTSIRAYTCLSPNYLMGHAYTQMGNLTGWQAGDVVYAYGKAFTVYSALTEQSCQPPVFPLAPLSMQTSLSPNTCGPVLVVQAR